MSTTVTPTMQATAHLALLQSEGAQRRRWIEDANEPGCYIPKSTLTIPDIKDVYGIRRPHVRVSRRLRLPDGTIFFSRDETPYRYLSLINPRVTWEGSTGPGFIVIGLIKRPSPEAPPISEITKAFYERDFDLAGLKHIFIATVVNYETRICVSEFIQSEEFPWPVLGKQTWVFGTPEYDALLGTRLGKVVAYFVLGAFERGTRRIGRVVTWPGPVNHPNMRFDIEVISESSVSGMDSDEASSEGEVDCSPCAVPR